MDVKQLEKQLKSFLSSQASRYEKLEEKIEEMIHEQEIETQKFFNKFLKDLAQLELAQKTVNVPTKGLLVVNPPKGHFFEIASLDPAVRFNDDKVETSHYNASDMIVFLTVKNFNTVTGLSFDTKEGVIVSKENASRIMSHYGANIDVVLQRTDSNQANSVAIYSINGKVLDPNDRASRSANHFFALRYNKKRINARSNNGLNFSNRNFR